MDVDTLNYFWVNGIKGAGSALGIPGFDADVAFENHGIPNFGISAFSGLGQGGTNWHQYDTTFQLSDVLSYTRGSHNLRAGFDARRMATWRQSGNQPRGEFNFTGDMSGYSMADFMLGVPRSVVTIASMVTAHVGNWRNGFFVNDVWQPTPKMTLNLGLRYELNTVAQTYAGFASELNEDFTRIIPSANPADYPVPGFRLHEPNHGDIAPRLGATYRLTDKTVLRGGWGIYFNPNQMNTFTFLTNNPPLAPRFTYNNDTANPTLTLSQPTGGVATTSPPDITTPNRHLPNAWKNQWSFDVQHELWRSTVVEVQYLASRTKNLDRSFFINTPTPAAGAIQARRPNPNFGSIRVIENDLIANYDSLAFVLRRRMTDGLSLNAHYTWSRTFDMADHSNGGGAIVNDFDIYSDYSRASWDVPHRFVLSGIYELPFFRNSGSLLMRGLLGGWQVSGVATFQSGSPLNVTIQGDRANVGRTPQRPDLLRDVELNCEPNPAGLGLINCIDPTAFAQPAQFTFGNAPRNMLQRPGLQQDGPRPDEELQRRGPHTSHGAGAGVQRVQRGQLGRPEHHVRCGQLRTGHVGILDAPDGARAASDLLNHVAPGNSERRVRSVNHCIRRSCLLAGALMSTQQTQTPPAQPPPAPTGYKDTPMQPNGKWHIHDGTRPQPRVVTPGRSSACRAARRTRSCCSAAARISSTWQMTQGGGAGELADRRRRAVERQGHDPHEAGRLHRLPAARRVRDAVGSEGQQPGARQQRRVPERRLRDPGARQLREHHLSGRPGVGDVRPVPADGERVARRPASGSPTTSSSPAPRFNGTTLEKPAVVTVLHNGVAVHAAHAFWGPTAHKQIGTVRAVEREGPHRPAGSRQSRPLPEHLDPAAQGSGIATTACWRNRALVPCHLEVSAS